MRRPCVDFMYFTMGIYPIHCISAFVGDTQSGMNQSDTAIELSQFSQSSAHETSLTDLARLSCAAAVCLTSDELFD